MPEVPERSLAVASIESSFRFPLSFPSVIDRYFLGLYTEPESGQHTCNLLHSNRICLITLAPTHPVILENQAIEKIDFQVTEQLNRLSNAVRGKGKKGAQVVDADAILCYIVTSDGQRHPVRTNVKGKIVEINPKLVERPELIRDDPRGEGYVAILLPKLPDGILEMKEMLATREDGAGPAASAPDTP